MNNSERDRIMGAFIAWCESQGDGLPEACRDALELIYQQDEDMGVLKHDLSEALDKLDREGRRAWTIEIEGGGNSWWNVCPECHGAVDLSDRFCRHCGLRITSKDK